MVNKNRQVQRMKKYFIEAGYSILLKKGSSELNVRNIAKKAGYSYATIYNYFNNFDELMWEIGVKVMEDMADTLKNHYQKINEQLDDINILKSVYKKYIDYFLENENLYHFIFFKNINIEGIEKEKKTHPPILSDLQQEIMKNCFKNDHIKKADLVIAGDLLTNSINGLLSLYFSGKENINKKELYLKTDQYIDYLIKD